MREHGAIFYNLKIMKIRLNITAVMRNVRNANHFHFSNSQNVYRLLCCLEYERSQYQEPLQVEIPKSITVEPMADTQYEIVYSDSHNAYFMQGEYFIDKQEAGES